jgi:hypothetical protein
MFSALFSEKDSKLDDIEDDLVEVFEVISAECGVDAERLNTGSLDFEVSDEWPIELALVNLLRPGILGASGLNTGNDLFSMSAI